MNLRDWFYRQKVTEAELDSAFGWCQNADRAVALDSDAIGVLQGLGLSETGPASMSLAYAAGVAYAKAGERCAAAVAGAIDCSQDEYGVPTAVANLGNTKWISVFMRPTRVLSEPRTDGNSNEVYTIKTEVGEVFVRQGSEGISPARVGLSSSAILLGEVELAHLQTAITTGDVDETRREDWVRTTTVTFGDKVHGTPQDAIVDMWAEMDLLGSGGGPFTFASQWFGATDVSGAAPPVTTFGEAIDAMVYDLSLATGSALIGTADYAGTYIAWSSAAVSGALSAIATAADQHIGGAAPQHPATSITYTPYLWIAAANVGAAITEIVDDLALTTGTSGAARIGNIAYAGGTIYNWFSSTRGYAIGAGTLQSQMNAVFSGMTKALPTDQSGVTPMVQSGGNDQGFYTVMRGCVEASASVPWQRIIAQDYANTGSSQSDQPAIPWAAPNYRDIASREFVDVCPGWDWSQANNGKPCFFAVSREMVGFYHLDYLATNSSGIGNATLIQPATWLSTYPTYMPIAIRSNGKYVYVLTAEASSKIARLFQIDVYTDPTTPTVYKTTVFSSAEVYDGSSYYKSPMAMGTKTLAFLAKHSTGTLTADEFVIVASLTDCTSWSKGKGNVGVGALFVEPQGALVHIGDDAYIFTLLKTGTGYVGGCAAQATLSGTTVTGVISPTAGPSAIYAFPSSGGTVWTTSAVFDGATAWFIDTEGTIFSYQHIGGPATESERWNLSYELRTNNVVDGTGYAPKKLVFDGNRVWVAARSYGENRLVMMSFDPCSLPDPVAFGGGFPAWFDSFYLNPTRTATWTGNGPVAGEGPGAIAIIGDVAMVLGRFYTPDGILHRVCNLSRRGGRWVA